MACCTSRRLVLVLSAAAAAVLLLLGAAAATTATAAPGYCMPGQAIPHGSPLSWCVWYVATRSCDVVAAMLPNRAALKEACCRQLQGVPAECRCRALRIMMETTPLVVGAEPAEQRRCRAAQRRFAPAVVAAAECGLRTVHGWPFCYVLDAEWWDGLRQRWTGRRVE